MDGLVEALTRLVPADDDARHEGMPSSFARDDEAEPILYDDNNDVGNRKAADDPSKSENFASTPLTAAQCKPLPSKFCGSLCERGNSSAEFGKQQRTNGDTYRRVKHLFRYA